MEDQQIPPASGHLDNFFNIAFDDGVRAQVRSAASWARICALCAFIGYGVALIVAVFGVSATTIGSENIRMSGFSRIGSIFGALISVAIGTFINYFLYRFATAATKGMDAMDSVKANEGFNDLRTYFKILGIILIIVLSFCALAILVLVAGAGTLTR
jgi:hypothetical protein